MVLDKHSVSLALVFIICKIDMKKRWKVSGCPPFTAKGSGSVPHHGTKIPQDTVWPEKKNIKLWTFRVERHSEGHLIQELQI